MEVHEPRMCSFCLMRTEDTKHVDNLQTHWNELACSSNWCVMFVDSMIDCTLTCYRAQHYVN